MTFDDAVPKKLIVLFVPSKDKDGFEIHTHHSWERMAIKCLVELYGGATSYNATGGWDSDGYLVTENVKAIHCYAAPEDFNNKYKQNSVIDFCKEMGRILNQSEVGLVVDGKYLGIRDFERSDDK